MHGVYNALVFTTFFIAGFLSFAVTHSFQRPMKWPALSWVTFWLMTAGLLMVDWALLTNRASVLYTSYAPLQAHWAYYLGLVLIVVGTLLLLANMVATYLAWRRESPGQRTPLPAFGAPGHHDHVGHGVAGHRGPVHLPAAPLVAGVDGRHRPADQPDALLVYGTPAGVLLAPAGLHVVVLHAAQAGGRKAVQRAPGAPRVPALHPAVAAGRASTTSSWTRVSPRAKRHPRLPHLRRLHAQHDHGLHRAGLAGDWAAGPGAARAFWAGSGRCLGAIRPSPCRRWRWCSSPWAASAGWSTPRTT